MTAAMLIAGLAGAHAFKFVYYPSLLASDPLAVFRTSLGIASFGGIFFGLAAAFTVLRYRKQTSTEILRYLDVAAAVFPFAWVLGRIGCFLSRDHPGRFTNSWFGAQYPDGTRFDLGLIEVLFTSLLIVAIPFTRRLPAGARTGMLLSAYGLFRFLLDRLHLDPPRYYGWTVDQLAAAAVTVIGLAILGGLPYTQCCWTSFKARFLNQRLQQRCPWQGSKALLRNDGAIRQAACSGRSDGSYRTHGRESESL